MPEAQAKLFTNDRLESGVIAHRVPSGIGFQLANLHAERLVLQGMQQLDAFVRLAKLH